MYTLCKRNKKRGELMEQRQFVQKLLEDKSSSLLQKKDVSHDKFQSYEGTPKKHPVDPNVLVLLVNPFEKNKKYYEFKMDSIADIEELETISSTSGENASRVRIWVQKGAIAFKTEPFII
jgi:hypothetical protein